jgi:hypothetical protein
MYSREVQKKIQCRYEAPREEPREAHGCLAIGWKATWLRHQSMLVNGYIVGACKGRLKQANLVNELKGTY